MDMLEPYCPAIYAPPLDSDEVLNGFGFIGPVTPMSPLSVNITYTEICAVDVTEPVPVEKPIKQHCDMTAADWVRGVAKTFDSYRLIA